MTKDMPARLFQLLALLERSREWTGADLARRLGVTTRTLRRDVDRLRGLGYPVDSTGGAAGGYRLVPGTNLPPLLLDDDDAVAIAVGLRVATGGSVTGIEENAVRALAKLEHLLPARLRSRVRALSGATVALPHHATRTVDPATLVTLAAACRDHRLVTFAYESRSGAPSSRQVEPHSLVTGYARWYLVGYDQDRAGWRTFRVDRLREVHGSSRAFDPRPLPAPDAATYLRRTITDAQYRYSAVATVEAPADVVTSRLRTAIPGRVEAVDENTCTVRLGADTLMPLAASLVALDADFTLDASPELDALLRTITARLTAALDRRARDHRAERSAGIGSADAVARGGVR